MHQRHTKTTKRRLGALLSIELVIALPVLLIVVFAAVEFSFLLLGSQAITAAANIGARQAALPSSTSDDVRDAIFQALDSWRWAEDDYLQVLIFVDQNNNGVIEESELAYDSQDNSTFDPPATDEVANAPTGTDIQVTINLPSDQAAPDLLTLFNIGLAGEELTATFITRKE